MVASFMPADSTTVNKSHPWPTWKVVAISNKIALAFTPQPNIFPCFQVSLLTLVGPG
jgi:hypothetical protein